MEAREAYEVEDSPTAVQRSDRRNRKPWEIAEKLKAASYFDLDLYDSVVRDYTSRELTYTGDRFDAFTAIIARYDPEPIRTALSGLPKSIFPVALLWKRMNKAIWMTRVGLDTRKSRVLPTWSWVGSTGAVSYEGVSAYDFEWVRVEEANAVFLKISKQPWDYQIEPYQPSPLFCVTLHVWTKAQRCRIEKQHWSLGSGFYDISLFDRECSERPILWHSIDACELDVQDVDAYAEYEIIELGIQILESRKSYMIIKVCDSFAERIGLLSMPYPSPTEDLLFGVNARDKHIRLR